MEAVERKMQQLTDTSVGNLYGKEKTGMVGLFWRQR